MQALKSPDPAQRDPSPSRYRAAIAPIPRSIDYGSQRTVRGLSADWNERDEFIAARGSSLTRENARNVAR